MCSKVTAMGAKQVGNLNAESLNKTGKKPNLFIKFVPRRAMEASFLIVGVGKKFLKRLA